MAENDLDHDPEVEDDWALLLQRVPHSEPEGSGVHAAIAAASAATMKDVLREYHGSLPLTECRDLVREVLATFRANLKSLVRKTDMVGLITIVLEAQDLPPPSLKQFVRALPEEIISRILRESGATTTGVHILVAIEHQWRTRRIPVDYDLRRDPNGQLCVYLPPEARETYESLTVPLGATFDLA